jgi:hypothetical protein
MMVIRVRAGRLAAARWERMVGAVCEGFSRDDSMGVTAIKGSSEMR